MLRLQVKVAGWWCDLVKIDRKVVWVMWNPLLTDVFSFAHKKEVEGVRFV